MLKITKKALFIGLIVILTAGGFLITNRVRAFSSDVIAPVNAEKAEDDYRSVSLRDKAVIGIGKYGFRQKIIVERPTIVSQYIAEDDGLRDVRYGIYEDKALTVPVKELDMDYIMDAYFKIEEGAAEEDFPDFSLGHYTLLNPGTYYAGLYTSDFWDFSALKFTSQFAPYEDEIKAVEGEIYSWTFQENMKGNLLIELPEGSEKGNLSVTIENYPALLKITVLNKQKEEIGGKAKNEYSLEKAIDFNIDKKDAAYIRLTWPAEKRQFSGIINICRISINSI